MTVIPVSEAAKPVAEIVIEVPTGPEGGLTEVPEAKLKVALGTEAADVTEPEAAIVWDPDGAGGTLKVNDHDPLASAVAVWPTGLPSNVTLIPLSLAPNPVPETVAGVPAAPESGLIDIPAPMEKFWAGTAEVLLPLALTA